VGAAKEDKDLIGSYMRESQELYADESPVEGAFVFLSFDREGARVVPNSTVRSDRRGYYRIELVKPQPAESDDGYYLHVSKPGHVSLVRTIRLGTFTPYKYHTVVLKRVPEQGA
jgi:hypothetical protein